MNLNPQEIIIRPMITERSMDQRALGKYTFEVHRHANKVQIQKAVAALFKVHVIKVNTIAVPGKVRRVGRSTGKTANRRKAIVTLKPGEKIIIKGIELFEES